MMDGFAPLPNDRDLPDNVGDALTGIHPRYTLSSTADEGSQIDKIMIKNFQDTLAKVALSIASRNLREKDKGGS